MTLLDESQALHSMRRPNVRGELPGPRSAELLAGRTAASRTRGSTRGTSRSPSRRRRAVRPRRRRQRVHRLPDRGRGAVAGPQPPGAGRGRGRAARTVHPRAGFPDPAKDAFTQAQLSMLPAAMRDRMKMHFCGPTGANAVDAAIKLCKTATGRGDIVSFQGGFHGSSHAAMAVTGLVAEQGAGAQRRAGRALLPVLLLRRTARWACSRDTCATNCARLLERSLKDTNGGRPAAGSGDDGAGAGRGRRDPGGPRVRAAGARADPGAGHPADRRRGADRLRAHRHLVRLRAVRHRARRDRRVQGAVRDRAARWRSSSTTSGWTCGRPARTPAPSAATSWPSRPARGPCGSCAATTCWATCGPRSAQVAGVLERLRAHPWVREVRGRGLMWGIELADPATGGRPASWPRGCRPARCAAG